MLSYAQNMEDVVLAQVFARDPVAGQKTGFYVDIGGGHAVADNVTFHAYQQGWHGLVLEPQTALARLYARVRPRDIVVEALAGRAEGTAELFQASVFHGLSTASGAHADAAIKAGVAGKMVAKRMATLASLLAAHAPAQIDVLKIDVEGHEAEVIAGNDWARFRPRVVLAEAIDPLSMLDASHRFEPQLLAAGYRFAFFDNLNRWYVAEEEAALLARFPTSPPDWGSVAHLGEYGAAHLDARHPDYMLGVRLAARVGAETFAQLPYMDAAALGETCDPAALARIASLFDGGYIVE
jgi:FkbM family methyltransferase